MKPAPFKYFAPTTIQETVGLLGQHGYAAKVLAGGQSLIPMMNFRLAQPSVIVDLNNVAELFYIRPHDDGSVRIGAMTRQKKVECDPLVAEQAPLVHEALPFVAYPQIRSRGTFGGSIAHADPAAELPAITVALNARFRIRSQRGERWIAAEDFFVGLFTTALQPDELLVEVLLPAMPRHTGWSFQEVARRHHDFALVGAAAVVTLDDREQCRAARLVFFSVGDGPVLARQAVQSLTGQEASPEAIRAAAATAATADIEPGGDINASAAYRRHLAEVLARRTLGKAVERARNGL